MEETKKDSQISPMVSEGMELLRKHGHEKILCTPMGNFMSVPPPHSQLVEVIRENTTQLERIADVLIRIAGGL